MINNTTNGLDATALPDYADLIAALILRPSPYAWDSVRVAWLFQTADALAFAGYDEDAAHSREMALAIMRTAIADTVGGGTPW